MLALLLPLPAPTSLRTDSVDHVRVVFSYLFIAENRETSVEHIHGPQEKPVSHGSERLSLRDLTEVKLFIAESPETSVEHIHGPQEKPVSHGSERLSLRDLTEVKKGSVDNMGLLTPTGERHDMHKLT